MYTMDKVQLHLRCTRKLAATSVCLCKVHWNNYDNNNMISDVKVAKLFENLRNFFGVPENF